MNLVLKFNMPSCSKKDLFSIGEYAYLGPCIDLQTGSFKLNDVKISASTFNVSLAFDFKF